MVKYTKGGDRMKITFLGTGAADWPRKRPEEYKEFRRLSSALIDDELLIDPGPQVPEALEELKKDPKSIKYVINTHSHSDHFSAETLAYLENMGASFIQLADGDVKSMGKYTVKAYKANHATCKNTVHFIISDGERTIFYGLDGAWLLYEEYRAIKEHKPDFAVFDATIGFRDGDFRIFEHNDINMVLEMQKTLKPYIKRFCISHMARTLHTDHKTLCEKMREYCIDVAYDGMETEI